MKKLLLLALLVVGCDYAPTDHTHEHTHDEFTHTHDEFTHTHEDINYVCVVSTYEVNRKCFNWSNNANTCSEAHITDTTCSSYCANYDPVAIYGNIYGEGAHCYECHDGNFIEQTSQLWYYSTGTPVSFYMSESEYVNFCE